MLDPKQWLAAEVASIKAEAVHLAEISVARAAAQAVLGYLAANDTDRPERYAKAIEDIK